MPKSVSNRLKGQLQEKSQQLGFHLFGIAPPGPFAEHEHYKNWLDNGYAAGMNYLEDRQQERLDPQTYFPGLKSVVCCGLYYASKETPEIKSNAIQIARYARGRDYHNVMKKRLKKLAGFLQTQAPCRTRICIDTAPVLDRLYAYYAGLGWFGKNTCLINRSQGSYFFIGEILTDLELPFDQNETDHCGTCRKCLDACPTGAFPKPYTLDANKCISYWTIEHRGDIPEAMQRDIGGHLFGCDICQEVCPWNHPLRNEIPFNPDPAFSAKESPQNLFEKLQKITENDFSKAFEGRPLKRARWQGLRRNAAIVKKNLGN